MKSSAIAGASLAAVFACVAGLVVSGCGGSATFSKASELRTATKSYLDGYPPGNKAEAQALLNLAKKTRRSLPTEGKRANLTWSATGEIIRGLTKDNPEARETQLVGAVDLLDEAITGQ